MPKQRPMQTEEEEIIVGERRHAYLMGICSLNGAERNQFFRCFYLIYFENCVLTKSRILSKTAPPDICFDEECAP